LRLTPFGVLALMANTVANTDMDGVVQLGKFVIASYLAILLMFGIHLLLVTLFGLNPIRFLQKAASVLMFAFTSRSSARAIPLNIDKQKDALGVEQGVANMSASIGATLGHYGCEGIYPALI